jgi:hypothetical protein
MEPVGLPILEVLSAQMSAVTVYSLISKRVASYLKSSVSPLLPPLPSLLMSR